jgi:TolA-binding protein
MEVTSAMGGNNDASGSGQGGGEIPIKTKEQFRTAGRNTQNRIMQNIESHIAYLEKSIEELHTEYSSLRKDENDIRVQLESFRTLHISAGHVMDCTTPPGGGGGGEGLHLGAGQVAPPVGQELGSV